MHRTGPHVPTTNSSTNPGVECSETTTTTMYDDEAWLRRSNKRSELNSNDLKDSDVRSYSNILPRTIRLLT